MDYDFVVIGSGVYLDDHTHVEAVRYPAGSDSVGLLTTLMEAGRSGRGRPTAWLAALLRQVLTRPRATLRVLWPVNFARETMILLCMQTLDSHLTMRWKRRRLWPFAKHLATEGAKIPAFIPQANAFAAKGAQATGGVPLTSVAEMLLAVPMTAHCMGGAAMGHTRADGVCDGKNRVFGYRNMYICDGSTLGANLGVNPSLTITALAEHAMSHVPPADRQTWDATGEEA